MIQNPGNGRTGVLRSQKQKSKEALQEKNIPVYNMALHQ